MAAPGPLLPLLLLLLLAAMFPHHTASAYIRQCLNGDDVVLGCLDGEAILVESAFLGVSEGHDPASSKCSQTSNKCHQPTTAIAEHCNRQQTCFLVYPNKTVVNLQTRNGCGLANYIEVTHICVKVSDTINICHWSGERGIGTAFIVNDDYPGAIPAQPHRCQCTLKRRPYANQTGVALLLNEAYFTGSSCQQKLYVEFPGHSTQNSTVCSSNQTVINRSIFSRASIESDVITLTFDKMLNISDAGTFMIEVQVVGKVEFQCSSQSNLTAPSYSAPTAATTNEHDTAKLGHVPGIVVGLAMALCSGIVIFVVMHNRRCLHCDGSSRTCIQSSDVTPRVVTSRAPVLGDPCEGAGTDDDPIDTSSSRHYEPLQGVTTSTPVTYENVQASNYESLNVAQNDPNGSTLPITT